MIKTKKELNEFLLFEKKNYNYSINRCIVLDNFINESHRIIRKYQRFLRIEEYHYNNRKNIFHLFLYIFYARKKQRLGTRLGITISHNVFDKGLVIDHYGSIVVNGLCKIGKNCRLHGNNCIGNKGAFRENELPQIGNNVDIGFGAIVIGDVTIPDNCLLAAGTIVVKTIEQQNSIICGIPGKIIGIRK